MSGIPSDLMYAKTHEWVRDEGDGLYTIGISDVAQGMLGDLVYVDLPDVGTIVNQGEECGVVESVKAASDVYAPLDGEIEEVNTLLSKSPETINTEPYDNGWLYRIRATDKSQYKDLLSADEYAEEIEAQVE